MMHKHGGVDESDWRQAKKDIYSNRLGIDSSHMKTQELRAYGGKKFWGGE